MSVITDVKAVPHRRATHETAAAQQLLRLYELTPEELDSIRAYGMIVIPRVASRPRGRPAL
jgi:hypothetical protein